MQVGGVQDNLNAWQQFYVSFL